MLFFEYLSYLNINRNIAMKIKIVMGSNKSEEFSLRDNKIAAYAKALGHPASIAILKLLIKKEACICGDIVEEIPLSQSTVSQHLKELKEIGLIKGEIEGRMVCYCIDEKNWVEAKELFGIFFESQTIKKPCCK